MCLQYHHGVIDFRKVYIRENPREINRGRRLRDAEKKFDHVLPRSFAFLRFI